MKPVVSVDEMRAVDAEATSGPAGVSEDTLVERAGTAVATAALGMLGGAYGRRVVVVAGKGNNGADGRVAAERLAIRGARVTVVDASDAPRRIGGVDLVIDAAYGTGFRGEYVAPEVPAGVKVLAVDIPSGVDGDTGAAAGEPLRADVTVTFAALKKGLVQGDGPALAGTVGVADIGLDASRAKAWLVDDGDVARVVPRRRRESHKWESAVVVVAGSPGMLGAAEFSAHAAYRSGAGMVRLAVPGAALSEMPPNEAVAFEIPRHGWAPSVLEVLERCKALVIGPGIGRDDATRADVRHVAERSKVPVVVDADALFAVGGADDFARVARARARARAGDAGRLVLTPHSGEFERIFGHAPASDRIGEAAEAAAKTGCVVLLKGSTTVVADAAGSGGDGGRVRVVTAGGPSLATAGTGDVLSGAIGAFVARGLDSLDAAAVGAHVHGRAASTGPSEGLVAGEIADLIARWLSRELV